MEIHIDRQHKAALQTAILADQAGNLLLPAQNIMGQDQDFTNSYTDHFKKRENSPWVVGKTERYTMSMRKEQYLIQHHLADQAHYSHVPLAIYQDSNWGIEAKIEYIAGSSDEDANFGFCYCMGQGYHVFYIQPQQQSFSIGSYFKHQWEIRLNDHPSKAIQSIQNTLRVECLDDYWCYYINNFLVYCEPKSYFFGSNFGFAIEGQAKIAADYFKIQW